MAELTLPKNSRIMAGRTWPKPAGATRLKEYRVYRYDPTQPDNMKWVRVQDNLPTRIVGAGVSTCAPTKVG